MRPALGGAVGAVTRRTARRTWRERRRYVGTAPPYALRSSSAAPGRRGRRRRRRRWLLQALSCTTQKAILSVISVFQQSFGLTYRDYVNPIDRFDENQSRKFSGIRFNCIYF